MPKLSRSYHSPCWLRQIYLVQGSGNGEKILNLHQLYQLQQCHIQLSWGVTIHHPFPCPPKHHGIPHVDSWPYTTHQHCQRTRNRFTIFCIAYHAAHLMILFQHQWRQLAYLTTDAYQCPQCRA